LSLPAITSPGGISFVADGTRLAVPGSDGATRLIILPIDQLLERAGDRLSRTFTSDECERYALDPGCPGS
jgi:hypothetical protein